VTWTVISWFVASRAPVNWCVASWSSVRWYIASRPSISLFVNGLLHVPLLGGFRRHPLFAFVASWSACCVMVCICWLVASWSTFYCVVLYYVLCCATSHSLFALTRSIIWSPVRHSTLFFASLSVISRFVALWLLLVGYLRRGPLFVGVFCLGQLVLIRCVIDRYSLVCCVTVPD
jgi:hypothetical protein